MSVRAALLLSLLILATVGATGFWYITVYDTAAAKCDRGDLGACTVVAAQQAQQQAEAEQQAAAEVQSRILDLATIEECRLYLPSNDAYVTVMGISANAACDSFIEQERGDRSDWTTQTRSDAIALTQSNRLICREDYGYQVVSVYDSGGAIIGSAVCEALIYQLVPVPEGYEY